MRKLEGYNSRIARLSELVALLESGELSVNDLSEMEVITRELHERSIILRYNAFKGQVLGDEEADEEIDVIGVEVEVVIEELDDEEEVPAEDEIEEQTIDFSIFDESEAEANEELPEPEPEIIPEIVIEEPTPIPVVEIKEPEPVVVPQPEPTPQPVAETISASASSFLDKFSSVDNSVASRFSSSKLDTLIGAFGLNQRLRYINDLFDGSSEVFSDAIKSLDNQKSFDEAKLKAAQLASENDWDPEEEVVVEFMSFLSRRYA